MLMLIHYIYMIVLHTYISVKSYHAHIVCMKYANAKRFRQPRHLRCGMMSYFANALSPAVGKRRDEKKKQFMSHEGAAATTATAAKRDDGTGASFLHNILFHFILGSFFRTSIYKKNNNKILAIISHHLCIYIMYARYLRESASASHSYSVENVSITNVIKWFQIHFFRNSESSWTCSNRFIITSCVQCVKTWASSDDERELEIEGAENWW